MKEALKSIAVGLIAFSGVGLLVLIAHIFWPLAAVICTLIAAFGVGHSIRQD